MSSNDFSPKTIVSNLKEIISDRKRLIFETIYAVWPFLFIALFIWLPLFTAKTTPLSFFNLTDLRFILWFTIFVTWLLSYGFYLISRVSPLKSYSIFFRIIMALIELFLLVVTLESLQLYAVILFPIALNISFSYFLIIFHFIIMILMTALEPFVFKKVNQVVEQMDIDNKEQSKAKKPIEPKVEEPQPKQEPPVEAPKEEAPVEEPKPEEPTEEVKPEQPVEEEKK